MIKILFVAIVVLASTSAQAQGRTIRDHIAIQQDLNVMCRGGGGDSEQTMQAVRRAQQGR